MKKLLFSFAFLCAMLSNAQTIETKSSCDSNTDGKVDVTDVSNTVNKVLGKAATEKQVVTAEDLNKLLKKIDARLSAIEAKLGCETPDDEEDGIYNGHANVDLGLSVKWATMNIGATEVAGTKVNVNTKQLDCYGEYYAWGETSLKDNYTSSSFFDSSYSKYNSKNKILAADDDVATVKWGGVWRMPTQTEISELKNNCYWEWTQGYNGTSVKGFIIYKVKSDSDKGKIQKYNSTPPTLVGTYSLSDNHIFLPAAGYYEGVVVKSGSIYGSYWSRSLSTNEKAYYFYFNNTNVSLSEEDRYYGQSVRAVCP